MAEERCNDCKPSVLVIELTKRVDKIEDKFEKVDTRFEKIDEKMDVITKETNASISGLKESYAETRAYAKATLEQISDLKSLFKNNNESNLGLIMQMMKTNSDAIVMNNKTNLEANKITANITKEIEIDKTSGRIEVTKSKAALFGTIIAAIVTVIAVIIEKIWK